MKVVSFKEYYARNSKAKAQLIKLMQSNGYLHWNKNTFDYYYVNYPYETNSFLLVTENNDIAGHLGFVQIKLSNEEVKACWCLHALIDAKYRNLSNFINLVKKSEDELKSNSYQVIIAMPNSSAADIYQKCLRWLNIGYINFSISHTIPKSSAHQNKPLYIKKDNAYWKWRLDINSPPSLVSQIYRWRNMDLQQILYVDSGKLQEDMAAHLTSELPICTWRHDEYTSHKSWWSCRFMYKLIDHSVKLNFGDINSWHLDMIDSDAFKAHSLTIL